MDGQDGNERKKEKERDRCDKACVIPCAQHTGIFRWKKKKQKNIRPKLSPRPMAISFLFSFRIHTPVAVAHSGKSVVPSDE